jgi:phage gpG-like protein
MNIKQFIQEIIIFAEKETQLIIAELQEKRFDADGAFNGHEAWARNSKKVIRDKGFNKPLYDSGELKDELTDPSNWDLNPQVSGSKLTLTIPDREDFTDSKYDVLDTGGSVNAYTSRRGNFIDISFVPARPFKDISDQDMNWITDKLVESIKRKFA